MKTSYVIVLCACMLFGCAPQARNENGNISTASADEQEKEYQGEPISLHFQEANILDVLQVIAEAAGLTLVVHPAVEGTVTVHLTNVPWEQALDNVLKKQKFDYDIVVNILRIAPAEGIQGEKKAQHGKQQKQDKTPNCQQDEELETKLITIKYAEAEMIANLIEEYFKGGSEQYQCRRGTIRIDKRTKTLIVQDTAENIKKIEQIVATLDRRTAAIMIEALVISLPASFRKELGIYWQEETEEAGDLRVGKTAYTLAGEKLLTLLARIRNAEKEGITKRPMLHKEPVSFELNVNPRLLEDDSISMVVHGAFSKIQETTEPGKTSNLLQPVKGEVTVQMEDGETALLGQVSPSARQTHSDNQPELLIFLTPRILDRDAIKTESEQR